MHMDWGRHLSPVLSKLRDTGAFCVMEAGDDPQNFTRNLIKAPWFDLILSPDIRSVNAYNQQGYNAVWWTHFADTNIHYSLNTEPQYIAVSSRGAGSSEILDMLAHHYEGQVINQNGWQGEEHTKFLNSGKIVIQHSRWGEITRRIFEGMACGKLVITDRLSKETMLENLFVDGKDIILYDDLLDCAEKDTSSDIAILIFFYYPFYGISILLPHLECDEGRICQHEIKIIMIFLRDCFGMIEVVFEEIRVVLSKVLVKLE